VDVTLAQVGRWAAAAGHTNLQVRESRRGWSSSCACGFSSPRVPTRELAEQAVTDHVMRKLQSWQDRLRASGRDPQKVIDSLPPAMDSETRLHASSGMSAPSATL
jgi:hypothetical protein